MEIHIVRTRDGGKRKVNITRNIAIKLFCTECMNWGGDDPKSCTDINCPLYVYRGSTQMAYYSNKQ